MPGFRTLEEVSVRWRPVEGLGLEHLTLRREKGAIVARGVVIGNRGGGAYGVCYTIICDPSWVVRSLELNTTAGRQTRLSASGTGEWLDGDGTRIRALDGCIDLDLAGTPFTNTLPIRRLNLQPADASVELAMAYVPFDTFSPTVDRQRYRCLEAGRIFRYEAVDRSFTADLQVDDDGLVIDYPGLFERVSHHAAIPHSR